MSEAVLALIAELAPLATDLAAPLELASLELVQLAEALEARFDFVVLARELGPENFGTAGRVIAFVARKRGMR